MVPTRAGMTFQIGVPRSRRDILAIPCPERFDGNKLDELPYSIVLASHRAVALLPESIHRPGITLAYRWMLGRVPLLLIILAEPCPGYLGI